MEIRYIPRKVNPTNTITQQVKVEDAEYTSQVKRMNQELVDMICIPFTAIDEEVQRKLDQLYNTEGMKEKKQNAKQQILTAQREEQNKVLAISTSRVIVDDQFKQRLMQVLRNEASYEDMIQKLEDPEQPNEIEENERVYRIKHGTLKGHGKEQKTTATYWRTVIPNEVDLKRNDSEGITPCTIFWTSRFYSHVRDNKTILLLEAYESRCAGFRFGLSYMSGKKR